MKLLRAKGADGLKPSRVFTHSTHRLLLIQRTKLNPDELKEIALQGLVKKKLGLKKLRLSEGREEDH